MKIKKKILISFSICVVILMIGTLSIISYANEYLKVYNFNFDDYKYGIEFYQIEKEQISSVADAVLSETLGSIDTAMEARRKAVSIFKKAYDEEMLSSVGPCKVYFDEKMIFGW